MHITISGVEKEIFFPTCEYIPLLLFYRHFQRYPVLYLDMTDFVTRYDSNDIIAHIQSDVISELKEVFPDVAYRDNSDLADVLSSIVSQPYKEKFIMIIDEWDAILREYKDESGTAEQYVKLLRGLFKSANSMSTFAGVYMTGILPIKKYDTQSALNNFHEYSVVQPGPLSDCFGFTSEEVRSLCTAHKMDYSPFVEWYDGYQIGSSSGIFNPTSVMTALYNQYCDSYWANTGAYDTVATYIRMNFDGLKDDVIRLLSGDSCSVDTAGFQNDLHVVRSKDDVLTLLIHLGYLSYDRDSRTCRIPNREVSIEFKNAIVSETGWYAIATAIKQSEQLLNNTLSGKTREIAEAIDAIHADNTSILQYNDENSLACVLTIAYYAAKKDFTIIRELPTGKGFADIVLLPHPANKLPAIVLELKYDKSAETAMHDAVALATLIYDVTAKLPWFEKKGLCDQLQRAVVSISSNIAEGSGRPTDSDFAHFLDMALGSANEVETQLLIARNLNYIPQDQHETLMEQLISVQKQLTGLISSIRNNS